VKIADLKHTPLEEGFFDNLVGRITNVAGGDGFTGLIRALMGEGAALKKLADAIEVAMDGKIRSHFGSGFADVKSGKTALPLTEIIKLGLNTAEEISKKETSGETSDGSKYTVKTEVEPVNQAQIIEFIKNNKAAVIKVAGTNVNEIIVAMLAVASGTAATAIPSLKYGTAIENISITLAAATILATGVDIEVGAFNIGDPAIRPLKAAFDEASQKVIDILLDPSNGLKQNKDFVENIENLIFVNYLNERIKKKYALMTSAQLAGLAGSTPDIITDGEYRRFLSQHNPSIVKAELDKVITDIKVEVQKQFKAWLEIAAQESASGHKPTQSMELFKAWGRIVQQQLNNAKYAEPPAAGATTTTVPPSSISNPLDNLPAFIAGLEAALRAGHTLHPNLVRLLTDLRDMVSHTP